MPDLDGFATTAQIHARLQAAAPPIIAMTANAMPSDREAALAAGMADHVGKPFDLEQLIGIILRHKRGSAPALLDCGAALARMAGNRGVYAAVLRGFPDEMDKLKLQFAELLAQPDGARAARALHVLRGLAGMVGAERLAALAGEVEARALAGAVTPSLAQDIGVVLAEMSAALRAVEQAAAL
jgi:CheY-like chemotaxis protein